MYLLWRPNHTIFGVYIKLKTQSRFVIGFEIEIVVYIYLCIHTMKRYTCIFDTEFFYFPPKEGEALQIGALIRWNMVCTTYV